MIRVAIETASGVGSVAVGRDDRVLAEVALGEQTRHAEHALPALDAALRLAGVERSGIGTVVVGAGPGSFTGVRVAGATAKGLATALGVPLLAYSSLLALAVDAATGAAEGVPICGLFDARRGEVYAGCWRLGDALVEVLAPRVGPVGEVVAELGARLGEVGGELGTPLGAGPAVVFTGAGAVRYADELERAWTEAGLSAARAALPAVPRASGLLWLAEHHGEAGAVDEVAGWEPLYVRGSSAERGIPG